MPLFLKVLACEIMVRELGFVAAHSRNTLDIEFLPLGYHENPKEGRARLQERIDAVPPNRYDAILLGYGLCNLMLVGLTARHTPLVIPRAHDCITLFLGSKERYQEEFSRCPGTYYYTAGWLEYQQRTQRTAKQVSGFTYEELVARYGEDNAEFLWEFFNQWETRYERGVWIEFPFTSHLPLREKVKQICQERGWRFEVLPGDLLLLQQWVDGEWDEKRFLFVRPNERVVAAYNGQIIAAVPCTIAEISVERER